MGKSRKSRRSIMKSIKKTGESVLPVVDKGLKTVGSTTKRVASASIPVIERGVSAVYDTMSTGLNLGMKGVSSVTKKLTKRRGSRSISLSGGRRHRRTRRHRKH